MKLLKPIIDKDKLSESIIKELEFFLYGTIFRPLLEAIKEIKNINLKNAKITALKAALEKGTISYIDGYFVGQFNSKLTKELKSIGAKYNKIKKAFKLNLQDIPLTVAQAIAQGKINIASMNQKMLDTLNNTERDLNNLTFKLDFSDQLNFVFDDLENQFVKSTLGEVEVISPVLTKGIKKVIAEEYNLNVNTYIKKWQKEAMTKLRNKVEKHVFEGFRADKLESILINEFKVSKNRAKLIAIQETSLLTSKYRKQKYKDAGITKYRWSTSKDDRVRSDHEKLDGKVFSFDSPPITNLETGARNNPGEDFRCRCIPIPILN